MFQMRTIIVILSLTMSGCFWSQANDTKAIAGLMVAGPYSCRYMRASEYNCGVDLHDCVVNGRPVQKIVCADNVVVERGY
jgi:succinate dehydrogenase/fumarate reductase flavoprotein subunit